VFFNKSDCCKDSRLISGCKIGMNTGLSLEIGGGSGP